MGEFRDLSMEEKRGVMERINDFILGLQAKLLRESAVITDGELDLSPTQEDKPSPHSHWKLDNLFHKMKSDFPRSDGYNVSFLANTNSMEPIIDDNSIVVSEDFTTEKGKEYLSLEPLSPGDICVYEGDPRVWGYQIMRDGTKKPKRIIHTIMKSRYADGGGKEYWFKGYNNRTGDLLWVHEDDIKARAFVFANSKAQRRGD